MPYFDTLKTLRERSGLKIAVLAKEADVDRSTITRIEKHHNSTPETLHAVINALNALNALKKHGVTIKYEDVITEKSKCGGK